MKTTLEEQLKQAEFCLRLYHEAWNGAEGDWRTPMRVASRDTTKYFHKFHPGDYSPRPRKV